MKMTLVKDKIHKRWRLRKFMKIEVQMQQSEGKYQQNNSLTIT